LNLQLIKLMMKLNLHGKT